MDRQALLALFDREQRVNVVIPGTVKETLPGIVRFTRPAPGMNFVLYSRLEPEKMRPSIQAQIDYFQPLGQPFEWIVYDHDSPPDLTSQLAQHGFVIGEREPILALDLKEAPPALLAPIQADVRRIETRAGLDDVIEVMERVYGGSFAWIRGRLGDHLEIPGYLSVYAAYADNRPACAGWIYYAANNPTACFAGLWGGSTVEDQRGKGFYQAVLARRVQEARERGCGFLYINASEMSEPIVRKHGFQLLDTMRSCEWKGE
jgi:GNAT superfamily N-acetyltransferase